MSNNASTGQKSSGPMGLPDKYVVDCPDCDFREVAQDGEWAAESVARHHAGETNHATPEVSKA